MSDWHPLGRATGGQLLSLWSHACTAHAVDTEVCVLEDPRIAQAAALLEQVVADAAARVAAAAASFADQAPSVIIGCTDASVRCVIRRCVPQIAQDADKWLGAVQASVLRQVDTAVSQALSCSRRVTEPWLATNLAWSLQRPSLQTLSSLCAFAIASMPPSSSPRPAHSSPPPSSASPTAIEGHLPVEAVDALAKWRPRVLTELGVYDAYSGQCLQPSVSSQPRPSLYLPAPGVLVLITGASRLVVRRIDSRASASLLCDEERDDAALLSEAGAVAMLAPLDTCSFLAAGSHGCVVWRIDPATGTAHLVRRLVGQPSSLLNRWLRWRDHDPCLAAVLLPDHRIGGVFASCVRVWASSSDTPVLQLPPTGDDPGDHDDNDDMPHNNLVYPDRANAVAPVGKGVDLFAAYHAVVVRYHGTRVVARYPCGDAYRPEILHVHQASGTLWAYCWNIETKRQALIYVWDLDAPSLTVGSIMTAFNGHSASMLDCDTRFISLDHGVLAFTGPFGYVTFDTASRSLLHTSSPIGLHAVAIPH